MLGFWWHRVKLFLAIVVLRLANATVPTLITVDVFVVRTWERFIADPLQVRGFSLSRQYMALYIVWAFGTLLRRPFSWWHFASFVWLLATVFFIVPPHLEPAAQEILHGNPIKISLFFLAVRCWLYFACVLTSATGEWSIFMLTAVILTLSSDSKPRRPKRLKRLVGAMEGI